jgi:hypothetical protein
VEDPVQLQLPSAQAATDIAELAASNVASCIAAAAVAAVVAADAEQSGALPDQVANHNHKVLFLRDLLVAALQRCTDAERQAVAAASAAHAPSLQQSGSTNPNHVGLHSQLQQLRPGGGKGDRWARRQEDKRYSIYDIRRYSATKVGAGGGKQGARVATIVRSPPPAVPTRTLSRAATPTGTALRPAASSAVASEALCRPAERLCCPCGVTWEDGTEHLVPCSACGAAAHMECMRQQQGWRRNDTAPQHVCPLCKARAKGGSDAELQRQRRGALAANSELESRRQETEKLTVDIATFMQHMRGKEEEAVGRDINLGGSSNTVGGPRDECPPHASKKRKLSQWSTWGVRSLRRRRIRGPAWPATALWPEVDGGDARALYGGLILQPQQQQQQQAPVERLLSMLGALYPNGLPHSTQIAARWPAAARGWAGCHHPPYCQQYQQHHAVLSAAASAFTSFLGSGALSAAAAAPNSIGGGYLAPPLGQQVPGVPRQPSVSR